MLIISVTTHPELIYNHKQILPKHMESMEVLLMRHEVPKTEWLGWGEIKIRETFHVLT